MKSAKLSERMTPMLWASLFQSERRRDRGAGQADEAEAGNRHAFPGLPECLGEHRGDRRQRDDDERNHCGVFSHCSLLARRGRRLAAGLGRGSDALAIGESRRGVREADGRECDSPA